MINKLKNLFKKKTSTKSLMQQKHEEFVESYTKKYGCWHEWNIRKIYRKKINKHTCKKCGKIELVRIK